MQELGFLPKWEISAESTVLYSVPVKEFKGQDNELTADLWVNYFPRLLPGLDQKPNVVSGIQVVSDPLF